MIPENLLPSSRKSIFLGHVNSAHFVTSYLFVSQYIITKHNIKYYVSPRFPNDVTNLRVHQPGISYNVIYVLFLDNLLFKIQFDYTTGLFLQVRFSAPVRFLCLFQICTRVGTLIVATIYLQLIQNRYMFRSFTVLQCSHQYCVQPVASDVEVVGYL